MQKRVLWERIRSYHFDNLVPSHLAERVVELFGGTDASTHAFAAKLALKLRWTTDFALRAIAEYRKFVYLGITSDDAVTPPKILDQVWHEHQLFTRGYREFCRDVLGRHFDHAPELIPSAEQTAQFSAQYDATLQRYRREFNMAPPREIWGTPKFNPDSVPTAGEQPGKKRPGDDGLTSTLTHADDTTPLYLLFDSPADGGHHSSLPEFGGGGGFSGGGGTSSWGGADSPGDSTSTDSSGHDAGQSDSGSGDAGSSSCSASSCGGGGD